MSRKLKTPADQPVRDRIVSEFDRNFLVEAGAGSGKTYSLAMRMAAGIERGQYAVDQMAAVTFTRKAAAELRGRFQQALEERLRANPSAEGRARLEAALSGIERLFAGTIHSFCAHLLRERPVDARIAPGFVELDDVENVRLRQRAWRDYVSAARARGVRPLLDLLDAGIKPKDLDQSFAAVCEHEDVTFDPGGGEAPDVGAVLRDVEPFWKALARLKPEPFPEGTKCPVQLRYEEFDARLAAVRRTGSLAQLGSLMTDLGKVKLTKSWWGKWAGRDQADGEKALDLLLAFQADVVDPFVVRWRAYVHRLAMAVLVDARDGFTRDRRRLNVVNYVDLLIVTATMLRANGEVRRALQRKHRWLFVDEFQDTDPVQAEIFLMLAALEDVGRGSAEGRGFSPGETPCDPFALPLRAGALFVVGDPKQSIFRFRRADIDIYNRVARRIVDTGGEVLRLTANFRSLPGVCDLANTVFPPLFANSSLPYSPAFEPLDPVRPESDATPGPRIATLKIPGEKDAAVEAEAALIASYIRAEVKSRRRTYGDFLVITRLRPRLGVYVEALDALEIPVEVSGASLFGKTDEVRALAALLTTLADPLDQVALVGVLRGPLYGISDADLFRFRQAGGWLELNTPLPDAADEQDAKALDGRYGPALAATRQLQEMLRLTRRLPLAAAVDAILELTGSLALAATTPGGARAGHLLQAVDEVRQVVESGGGLADAAAALGDEEPSGETEALPLEPGRRDVVRLMNLHKAKGLEAPVVILADPQHTFEFPIVQRVERNEGRARGHLRVVRKNTTFGSTVLGQPLDWGAHELEEQKYVAAERLRLLYVAGTRAKDLLIVGQSEGGSKNKAWGEFDWYLSQVPEITVRLAKPAASKLEVDLSAGARAAAGAARASRHDRVRAASYSVTTPTGEKALLTTAERAAQETDGPAAAASMPDAATQRIDRGAAWGSLLHGLLEHAMRHGSATREDLARLAQWLTVETPDLRPFVPQALDWVDSVREMPFWKDAEIGGARHVEVPFAVRLEQPDGAQRPVVLRGAIDFVYQSGDTWRILDYKSDQLDGLADVDTVLKGRYGPQLAQYKAAWEQVSGGRVESAELVALRARRVIRVG